MAFLLLCCWKVIDSRDVHNYLQGLNLFIYFEGGRGVPGGIRTGHIPDRLDRGSGKHRGYGSCSLDDCAPSEGNYLQGPPAVGQTAFNTDNESFH